MENRNPIFLVPVLFLSILNIRFHQLPVYTWNGQHVIYKNIVFETDSDLFHNYINGQIKPDYIIGKTADSKFLGFKTTIYKAKGYDKNQVIIIQELMFDDILNRQDQ